jgi:hypothetical protein
MNGIELDAALSGMNQFNMIQGIAKKLRIIDYATVSMVKGKAVDAMRGTHKYTNVEVLNIGGNGYSLDIVPAIGDTVLLISSCTAIVDTAGMKENRPADSYSAATLKCIPLCSTDSKTSAGVLTIDMNGVKFVHAPNGQEQMSITYLNSDGSVAIKSKGPLIADINAGDDSSNNVQVNADGITVTDIKGNNIVCGEDGMAATDLNGNTAIMNGDGIEVTDLSGNDVTMSSDGITVTDANSNKVEMANTGITVTDTNSNKVEMSSSGMTLQDSAGNKVEMTSSAFNLVAASGCKVEMGPAGTVINGKLTVMP